MRLADFDYELPPELIAQTPARQRDASRLLVVDRDRASITHTRFTHLPDYVRAGDLLVANDTRVIPARVYGSKSSGGWVELFLLTHRETPADGEQIWECLVRSRRPLTLPCDITCGERLRATVTGRRDHAWLVRLRHQGNFAEALDDAGRTPLPPYIKRARSAPDNAHDRDRYQTVYATRDGAVAAPTAGLHFTPALIEQLRQQGAGFTCVTLHVGYGTFEPIRSARVDDHQMHREAYAISPAAAAAINRTRQQSGRIIAVGTTATRTLETVARRCGSIVADAGHTGLFLYPGSAFHAVDAMVTNFHLPRSSLLLLVCAFAGRDLIMEAYRQAIAREYRFFSYGDAMLIL